MGGAMAVDVDGIILDRAEQPGIGLLRGKPQLIEIGKIDGIDQSLDALGVINENLFEFLKGCEKISSMFALHVPAVITVIYREGRYTCVGNCDAWIAAHAIYGADQKIWCLVLNWQDGVEGAVKEIVQVETIMALARLRTRKVAPLVYKLVESLGPVKYSLLTNGRPSLRAILKKLRMSYRSYIREKISTEEQPQVNEKGLDITTPIKSREKNRS
jgi:hypothetical protein